MTRFVLSLSTVLFWLALLLPGSHATAQVTTAQTTETEYVTGPDQTLLRNGLWTLGVMYATSVVVAIASPRPSDDYLFIPVAGPWLDLSNRDARGGNDGDYENLYQALLIADGVIQAVGAAQVALSLIFPETRLVERTQQANPDTYTVRARPLLGRGTIGLSAVGVF